MVGSTICEGTDVEMPWFPDFVAAAELARRETRASGQEDPVRQYLAAYGPATRDDIGVKAPSARFS